MRVVLLAADAVEQVHAVKDVAIEKPFPAVVRWRAQVFVFAYQENEHSLVYRKAREFVLPEGVVTSG